MSRPARALAIAGVVAASAVAFAIGAPAAQGDRGRGGLAVDESAPFYGLIDGHAACARRAHDWAPPPAGSDYGTAIATTSPTGPETTTQTIAGTSRGTGGPGAGAPVPCS